MVDHMKRGLMQILYKLPPGANFTNTKNNTLEKVNKITGEEIDLRSEEEIIRTAYKRLNNWEGGSRKLLKPSKQNYAVVEPSNVYSDIFPRVFYCQDCRRIHDYSDDRIRKLEENGRECQRDGCSGEVLQIHHVMLCPNCSEQTSINVPPCENHGWKYIKLDDRADRYENFRWVCELCSGDKEVERGLGDFCNSCNNYMIPAVHTSSKTYRVHDFTKVDLSDKDVYRMLSIDDEGIDKIVLGAYFGVFDHPKEKIEDIATQGGSGLDISEVDSEEELEILKKYNAIPEDANRQEIISKVNTYLDDAKPSSNLRRYIMSQEALGFDHIYSNRNLSDRTIEFLDIMGIQEISITSEFPLLKAVYGYHRTFKDQEKDEVTPKVRTFPLIKVSNREHKKPIYAKKTQTEAAIIQLDPKKVGHWLHINGFDIPDTLDMNEEKARVEIYKRMENVEPYSKIGDDGDSELTYNSITIAIHRLLHTISHLFLQRAAVYSGIEETSFAEYMFPEALSTAIYSNKTESYTAGGLFTLIDRNLKNWLAGTIEESEHCFYDSTCADIWGGSCHACVHTSEVGCQFFNKNLSRVDLYGDRISSIDKEGFWTLFR